MPSFTKDSEFHYVSWISGPSHVRLGVKLAATKPDEVAIIRRPAIGTCEHGKLDESKIRSAVDAGFESANAACATSYCVGQIVYVANDSPRYAVYERCASLLVERLASREPFDECRH